MAANLDKAENALTQVSTVSYVRGIDASGNSVLISASNLASVLGACNNLPDTNLDNVKTIGRYAVSTNATGKPEGASYGFLDVYVKSTTDILQIFQSNYSSTYGMKPMTWKRVQVNNGAWTDWCLTYDHSLLSNSTELSSLASALGGVFGEELEGDFDFNSIPNGWTTFGNMNKTAQNAPKPSIGTFGVIFQRKIAYRGIIQIVYFGTYESPKQYYIGIKDYYLTGTTWTDWTYIQLTS